MFLVAWKFIGGIVKKIPWQIWVCAGLALTFWSWGEWQYHRGEQEVQNRWAAAIKEGKLVFSDFASRQQQTTKDVVTVYVDRVKVIHEKGEVITKLVTKYIPADTCTLPGGVRLLHDAAATNSIPEAPGGVNDSAVSAQDLTTTVTENYTQCHKDQAKLTALQAWAEHQYQLYLELCKQPNVRCSEGSLPK